MILQPFLLIRVQQELETDYYCNNKQGGIYHATLEDWIRFGSRYLVASNDQMKWKGSKTYRFVLIASCCKI